MQHEVLWLVRDRDEVSGLRASRHTQRHCSDYVLVPIERENPVASSPAVG